MRLCNNGTDVVPELMMFKLSFCFSVSTSLSPSMTPSWWFQVLGLLVLYGLRPAVAHIKHRRTRTMQATAHTLALNAIHWHVNLARVHTTANTQKCKCWLRCHSAPRPPLPFNDTERRTQAADGGCIVKRIDSDSLTVKSSSNTPYETRQIPAKKELLDTILRCVKYLLSCQTQRITPANCQSHRAFFPNHLFTPPSHILIDPCQLTPVSISTNKHPHWQELGTKCCEHNLRERLLVSFLLLNQYWSTRMSIDMSCCGLRWEVTGRGGKTRSYLLSNIAWMINHWRTSSQGYSAMKGTCHRSVTQAYLSFSFLFLTTVTTPPTSLSNIL